MKRQYLALGALILTGAQAPAPVANSADLQVQLSGLRSAKGVVHLCLTSDQMRFLKCKESGTTIARTIPAGEAQALDLGMIKPGNYALLIVHDENGNGKLDMMMGIPREGFGFSNNPAMRPRAPKWDEIRFSMPARPTTQSIRIRYVL